MRRLDPRPGPQQQFHPLFGVQAAQKQHDPLATFGGERLGNQLRQIDAVRDDCDRMAQSERAQLVVFLAARGMNAGRAADDGTLQQLPERTLFWRGKMPAPVGLNIPRGETTNGLPAAAAAHPACKFGSSHKP